MWRRSRSGGWGRRRGAGTGRAGFGYSYGAVVLLISAAILLFVYLSGRLSF